MKKPHVVFVTEKWCDCKPERGLTNSFHNLFGSLETTELATYENIFFDFHKMSTGFDCSEEIIKQGTNADLIIATTINGHPSAPKLNVFGELTAKGKKVASIHFDSASPKNLVYADQMLDYIDFNIVLDSSSSYKTSPKKDRYLALWTPQDQRLFNDQGLFRDINVSFAGTTKNRKDREGDIGFLGGHGLPVYVSGGQRESALSPEQYANVLQRSEITLNWAGNQGFTQLKGRIFEAMMCGALLFESENDEIKEYFVDGEDYVAFKGDNNFLESLRGYLEDETARKRVAKNGYFKCQMKYNAKNWWQKVFERAGIDVGHSDPN